jgi:hypothetical protein
MYTRRCYQTFKPIWATVSNISVKTVTSISAMVSELAWADVVIFPPITNSSNSSTDYTAVQADMEDWIEDGGKMIVMGSTYVDNILSDELD